VVDDEDEDEDEDEDKDKDEDEGEGEAQALLGEDPVYKLDPSIDIEKITSAHCNSTSFMLLSKAPQAVQTDFSSVEIPKGKIASTFVMILTTNLLANETIINEGLRAFIAIVKLLGWKYCYVGASMKTRLLGPVRLERSIPIKGTQLRKGLPAPLPNITPPFVSNLLAFCDHRWGKKDIPLHGTQRPAGGLAAKGPNVQGARHSRQGGGAKALPPRPGSGLALLQHRARVRQRAQQSLRARQRGHLLPLHLPAR
jgi:hypothetical protein